MRMRSRLALVPTLALLIACANAPVRSGNGGSIDHATGRSDLLVRVEVGGGLVPVDVNLTSVPVFSLYGDGTVVVPGAQIELYPGQALPAISSRSVDETAVQTILEEALATTEDLPEDLDDTGDFVVIADATTVTFTVNAGGQQRRIEVYALYELERPQGISEDVYRARQELLRLITRLSALDQWVPEGSLDEESMYVSQAARIFVGRYRPVEDLHQESIAWPIAGSLSRFGDPTEPAGYRCGTLGGGDWTAVREAAGRANQLTPWTDAGQRYSILFRPLLPDESGC